MLTCKSVKLKNRVSYRLLPFVRGILNSSVSRKHSPKDEKTYTPKNMVICCQMSGNRHLMIRLTNTNINKQEIIMNGGLYSVPSVYKLI